MKKILTTLVVILFLGLFSSCKEPRPTVHKYGPVKVESYRVRGYEYEIVTYKGVEFLQHNGALVKVQ